MGRVSKGGRALSKNEKILLAVLSAVSIIFIINTFIIVPSNNKIKPLQDEVNALKDQVKNIQGLDISIKTKEKQLDGLKAEFDEATKSIPKTDRYPQVLKDLEAMAYDTSANIKNYTFSKPIIFAAKADTEGGSSNKAAGLQTFSVQMTIDGDFNNILSFINKLESDSRIKEVVTMSSTKDSSTINVIYYVAGGVDTEDYDFNNSSYGKSNLFN